MAYSKGFRRWTIVAAIIGALLVIPGAVAWASGTDLGTEQTAPSGDGGLLQQILDWLIRTVSADGSSDPNENGDSGGGFDPMG